MLVVIICFDTILIPHSSYNLLELFTADLKFEITQKFKGQYLATLRFRYYETWCLFICDELGTDRLHVNTV